MKPAVFSNRIDKILFEIESSTSSEQQCELNFLFPAQESVLEHCQGLAVVTVQLVW